MARREREPKREGERGLATWDPFREFDLFPRWGALRESPLFQARERGALWAPALDIHEGDDAFTITVELAGASKDDVTVEAHGDVLTIRGEKRSEREEAQEERRWVERSYGSFARSFTLPPNANADRIEAAFANGVLTVKVPKREEKKPQTIAVR